MARFPRSPRLSVGLGHKGHPPAGPLKLPGGQTVKTHNPVRELAVNLWARREALVTRAIDDKARFGVEMPVDDALLDMWSRDALNPRYGVPIREDRAHSLGIDLEALDAFDAEVMELEQTIWKKAADFYNGLCRSGIFDQTVLVRGGLYVEHTTLSWRHVEDGYGVSRRTVYERLRAGASLVDALKPAREKAAELWIEHEGATYSVDEFSAAFGLSRPHVRRLAGEGLKGTEIIAAPKPSRGRPKGATAGHPQKPSRLRRGRDSLTMSDPGASSWTRSRFSA